MDFESQPTIPELPAIPVTGRLVWLRGHLGDRLVRGVLGTFGLKIGEALATFALSIVLARLLGAAGLGVYALALAWANLLFVPALMGHENLTIRHVAAYSGRAAWSLLNGYLRRSYQVVGLASLVLGGGAAIIAWFVSGGISPQLVAFWLAMAFVPVMASIRLTQAALRGLRHVATGYLPELGVLPLLTFAFIGLVLLVGDRMTPALAVGLQLTAGVGALTAGIVFLWRLLPAAARRARPEFRNRQWLGSALPLLFIGGTQVVNRQADIVMLGAFIGDAAAGVYSVATRSAGLIGFVLFAVNAGLAPIIARVYEQNDMARLQRIATRSARLVLLFSVPATLFFILFGGWFLGLFGHEFKAAAAPLAILAFGQFMNASVGSVALLLTMTGHEQFAARGFGLGALVNVLLNLAFIPLWGTVGAAIATCTSLILWNAVLAWYVYRLLGLHSTALGVIRLRRGE